MTRQLDSSDDSIFIRWIFAAGDRTFSEWIEQRIASPEVDALHISPASYFLPGDVTFIAARRDP